MDSLFGVLLPKTNWGGGFFPDSDGPGTLTITSDAPDTNIVTTPPATLADATLTLTPGNKQTGSFRFLSTAITFEFTSTNVIGSGGGDVFGAVPSNYNYSSQAASGINIVELNIGPILISQKPAVLRLLLNFQTDTSGTYVMGATAGGSGSSAGTFTMTVPAPPAPAGP